MEKKKNYVRIEKYDGLTGKWVRDIKPNDIFNLNAVAVDAQPGTSVATTIVGANFTLFVHGIDISCVATSKHIAIMENATTRMIIPMQGATQRLIQSQSLDTPLFKIAGSSTIKIRPYAAGASTFSANLYGIRVPINSKVETT